MSVSASDWYDKSLDDLDMVRRALEPSPGQNLGGAAYHVQQAAEKLLKGYLTHIGVAVPRTHDIATIAAQIPHVDPLKADAVALDAVTPWATIFRYPPDDPATNTPPELKDVLSWKQRIEDLTVKIKSASTPNPHS